jgi:hypothetical protein
MHTNQLMLVAGIITFFVYESKETHKAGTECGKILFLGALTEL